MVSYGVIVLELSLMGQGASSNNFREEKIHLNSWFLRVQSRVLKATDPEPMVRQNSMVMGR